MDVAAAAAADDDDDDEQNHQINFIKNPNLIKTIFPTQLSQFNGKIPTHALTVSLIHRHKQTDKDK